MSRTNTRAANLQTTHIVIPDGQVVILPHDPERTFFAIQDRENSNITLWVGGAFPTEVVDNWFSLSGSDGVDILKFPAGVAGPIYIGEDGAGAGACTIISSRDESDYTVEDEPTAP